MDIITLTALIHQNLTELQDSANHASLLATCAMDCLQFLELCEEDLSSKHLEPSQILQEFEKEIEQPPVSVGATEIVEFQEQSDELH